MASLSYHDVFLPQKEEVMNRFAEMDKQIKALTFAVVKQMVDKGERSIRVDRDEFTRQMHREGIEEPINLVFRGNKTEFVVSIE